MGRTPAGRTRERIYRFLQQRLLAGRPPTVREVQARFRFRAVQTAREHLERLVAEGRLAKEAGKARGYRLPLSAPAARLVPVLGRVQAGEPTTAVEDLEGYVCVQGHGHAHDELFGLHVRGPSMSGRGIFDGDLVLVRRQSTADSGDIVVALVGDEATVKILRKKGRRIELHPAHPDFRPLCPDPDGFVLLGKVIELRRSL